MWKELPKEEREKYKDYILGLTSCSKAFSQKTVDPVPIIISKYQESAFQDSFCCISEDINNTSFDTAKIVKNDDIEKKFLIGIKTFGFNNSMQKIAQFKSELNLWQHLISLMRKNAKPDMSKEDINRVNHKIYKELAIDLSMKRNERIQNSMSQLRSFSISSLIILGPILSLSYFVPLSKKISVSGPQGPSPISQKLSFTGTK